MHVNQRWEDSGAGNRTDRRTFLFGVPSRSEYLERERYAEDRAVIQQAMLYKSASKFLEDQENV